ncbi:RRQRL motif-containing zinc-binding protein [Amycolatopsis rhabdoformis]|uniref:RRQRL motif-containing zinc-binding protein n=1 Tax=Amycolatopsis rhabdoformis TaxID=1448059 RepID=A0ABZ1I3R4_9PSEU|nr:RRQRL motif-containing zinc-binding protein [Amycolatopsis rhabdoformis]WSE29053.1 RRQRL motif-containing zinc-binding protein [Amycolatopsis rhabdoformis]
MNPRNRKQQVTTVFDGRTHHACLCRGFRDGLPMFGWGEAPSTLLTRAQLREAGLRPNGQDPVALLVFRHVKPYAHETVAELFSVERAALKRTATPAQLVALSRAMDARRVCVDCGVVQEQCVPTSTRQCGTCEDTAMADQIGVAA